MKILRAIGVLSGAAILLLGTSARPAPAGEFYGWGPCPGCGGGVGGGGHGYRDRPVRGYGAYGSGFWRSAAAVGISFGSAAEYARYVIGHGPMYTGENYSGPTYSYSRLPTPAPAPTPDTSARPARP